MYDQDRHLCRLEWGRGGALRAGRRGDVVIVVDALSFATTVATGVAEGLSVMPCTDTDDLDALVRQHDARLAHRRELSNGGLSLSPLSLTGIGVGTRVVLRSPNGATCTRLAAEAGAARVFAAAFVNAGAAARQVARVMADAHAVTIVACGERWPADEPGTAHGEGLRVAIEDELAAGCLVARLREHVEGGDRPRWASPEARTAELAWRGLQASVGEGETVDAVLAGLLREAVGGLELRRRGFAGDVDHAARLDALDVAPVLDESGWFVASSS